MTFWAKRADRHPNTPASTPDKIEVHTTYGPIEIKVTEDLGHVKSFHADLGRLIDETEAVTAVRLAEAADAEAVAS